MEEGKGDISSFNTFFANVTNTYDQADPLPMQ